MFITYVSTAVICLNLTYVCQEDSCFINNCLLEEKQNWFTEYHRFHFYRNICWIKIKETQVETYKEPMQKSFFQ